MLSVDAACLTIVGAQWGDEGKGKLVDLLSQSVDWVVRFQGGDNAGHSIVLNGETVKLRLTPCGILNPNTRCLIAAGVALNCDVLKAEIAALKAIGVDVNPQRLVVDREAHLVMPYHPVIDVAREKQRGVNSIGTTGRGIGPAYEDRAARNAVRVADLSDLAELRSRLSAVVDEKIRLLQHVLHSEHRVTFEEVWSYIEQAAATVLPHVGNGSYLLDQAIKSGRKVIFEGAQAALLDQTFGTVPYVTSSHTISGAVATGCGIGPSSVGVIMGVAKGYCTRVGAGPFPTEVAGEVGDLMRERGHEYGTVTGRPRRCGWLDAVALRRAVRISGMHILALTKLDVLSGFEQVKICTGYKLDGRQIDDLPALASELARVEPIYQTFPAWEGNLEKAAAFSDLPPELSHFVRALSAAVGCPVAVLSLGAERNCTVFADRKTFQPYGDILEKFVPGEFGAFKTGASHSACNSA